MNHDFHTDPRFQGIDSFARRVYLASPTMHPTADRASYAELDYIREAFDTNWVSCLGENVDQCEQKACEYTGMPYAVALTCGTAAIHLALKLAAKRVYGAETGYRTADKHTNGGALYEVPVFCSDMTFDAAANPIVYEGGIPVFIDAEPDTWNMDPKALEKAFEEFPETKIVVLSHLYGIPSKMKEIREICDRHEALLIEDAAESLGAAYNGQQTGSFGDYCVLSFNGNKIITGSTGGMLLTHDKESADRARKWSTQSRDPAPWYEHTELGYNYRMSNLIAGVIRGQWAYLEEHIAQKKAIAERYREGLKDLPLQIQAGGNYWLTCALIDEDAMAECTRLGARAEGGCSYSYTVEAGKSCPDEILDALQAFNAEGRPIWKPMHLQPIYTLKDFVTTQGVMGPRQSLPDGEMPQDDDSVSADIFRRGLCLPSDNKMTLKQQDVIIDIIRRCF